MSTFTSMNPLMMNEVGALAKKLPTFIALIRLFSSVNSLMLNEVGASAKEFPTFAAYMGAFTSVNSLMFNETGMLAKEFPTFAALIRLSSIVISLVLKKASGVAKEYPAFAALIRPFSSVGFLVLSKCKFVTDSVPRFTVHVMALQGVKISHTFGALLWLLHTVSDLMLQKVRSGHSVLPTLPECERFLRCVISAALHKRGPPLPASDRLIYILLHFLLMKVCIELELLPICLIFVWFLTGICCLVFSQVQNVFQV